FAEHWLELGSRFVPNGVGYLDVRARALTLQGKIAEARAELARVTELPTYYGLPAQSSDSYLAAVIHVALAANDLPAARAALAQRGSLEAPDAFNLDYLQLAIESARLKLRMGDVSGASALTDAALAHLRDHAGETNFAFMREPLEQIRREADALRMRAGA